MSRVVLHANAGGEFGMGHLVRAVTLGECARSRGWDVLLGGDLSPEAVAQAGSVPVDVVPGKNLPGWLSNHAADGVDVIHLDTYDDVALGPTESGPLTSSMQDGPFGARPADLAIDANLGAEFRVSEPQLAGHHLLGADVAVVREAVLAERGRWARPDGRPRVLIAIGGTDPHDVTGRVVTGLNELDEPLDLTVVARPDRLDALRELAGQGPHAVEVTGFLTDLPAVARRHSLVISGAGTTLWDFACMGVPTAALAVADNQRDGYRAAVDAGLIFGLGEYPVDNLDERLASLRLYLDEDDELDDLSRRAMATVDGGGAWRIVRSWETLLGGHAATIDASAAGIAARPATKADSDVLLAWRNDPVTRAGSRSDEPVSRINHLSWLTQTLATDAHRLFIIEQDGKAIGTVRFDSLNRTDWEVSVTVAPDRRGRGEAAAVLAAGERALDVPAPARFVAAVRESNEASARLFAASGYLPHQPADAEGFTTSIKWRTADPN